MPNRLGDRSTHGLNWCVPGTPSTQFPGPEYGSHLGPPGGNIHVRAGCRCHLFAAHRNSRLRSLPLKRAMSSLASGHCNDQSQYCESLASAGLFSFWRRESKQWGQGPLRHTTATVARSVHTGTLRRRFVSVLVGGFRARPRQGIPCGPGPRTSAH